MAATEKILLFLVGNLKLLPKLMDTLIRFENIFYNKAKKTHNICFKEFHLSSMSSSFIRLQAALKLKQEPCKFWCSLLNLVSFWCKSTMVSKGALLQRSWKTTEWLEFSSSQSSDYYPVVFIYLIQHCLNTWWICQMCEKYCYPSPVY